MPFVHINITDSVAASGARTAIITIPSPDIAEAMTIFELTRTTQVPVPTHVDTRGSCFASTWRMQRRRSSLSMHENRWQQ